MQFRIQPSRNITLLQKNLLNKTSIVKVTCGSSHVLALNDNGQVYSWGDNQFGKLG